MESGVRGPSHEALPRALPSAANASEPALSELAAALARASDADLPERARELALRGGEDAVRALGRFASSPRAPLREAALRAIATLDSEPARTFMLSALTGAGVDTALEYFKDCVDPRAVAPLERLARESAPELGRSAVDALVAQGPSAHASLLRLANSDTDASSSVFSAASSLLALRRQLRALAIRRLGAGASVDPDYFAFLAQDRSTLALSALVAAAREPVLTQSAVGTLSARGDPASNAALWELLRSGEPQVACEAKHAMLLEPESRSLELLSRVGGSRHSESVVLALLRIGAPEGSRSLRALRTSDDALERVAGAQWLVEFGPSDAQRLLRDMLGDPSPRVRFVSQAALLRLGVEVEASEPPSRRLPP